MYKFIKSNNQVRNKNDIWRILNQYSCFQPWTWLDICYLTLTEIHKANQTENPFRRPCQSIYSFTPSSFVSLCFRFFNNRWLFSSQTVSTGFAAVTFVSICFLTQNFATRGQIEYAFALFMKCGSKLNEIRACVHQKPKTLWNRKWQLTCSCSIALGSCSLRIASTRTDFQILESMVAWKGGRRPPEQVWQIAFLQLAQLPLNMFLIAK